MGAAVNMTSAQSKNSLRHKRGVILRFALCHSSYWTHNRNLVAAPSPHSMREHAEQAHATQRKEADTGQGNCLPPTNIGL